MATEIVEKTTSQVLNYPTYYKVLVVEDNVVNQKVVVNLLKKINFQSDLASNGFEAVESMKKNQYDIVLMDCHMVRTVVFNSK